MRVTERMEKMVREIRKLHAEGLTYPEIDEVLFDEAGYKKECRSYHINRTAWAKRLALEGGSISES